MYDRFNCHLFLLLFLSRVLHPSSVQCSLCFENNTSCKSFLNCLDCDFCRCLKSCKCEEACEALNGNPFMGSFSCESQNAMTTKGNGPNSYNTKCSMDQTTCRPSTSCTCTPSVVTTTVTTSPPFAIDRSMCPEPTTIYASVLTTEPCTDHVDAAFSREHFAALVSVNVIGIALILATLTVIIICMRAKRRAKTSKSRDDIILTSEPMGRNRSGLSSVQGSPGSAKMPLEPQHHINQAYDNASSNAGLQHTYATLESPPISKSSHWFKTHPKPESLVNPIYYTDTSTMEPNSSLQPSQDNDALASDYLEPVSALASLLTEKEKTMESGSCPSEGYDQTSHFQLAQVPSNKPDIIPEPSSCDPPNKETSPNHDYFLLEQGTIKE